MENSCCCSHDQIFCKLWYDKHKCYTDNFNGSTRETAETTSKNKFNDVSHSFSADSINCGVTISFLVDFCNHFNLWNISTRLVWQKFIVPMTIANQCCFVDLPEVNGSGISGTAATFISHCWDGKFGDLVAAICDGVIDFNRRVWINIFALVPSHGGVNSIDLNYELVIKACPSFLLICPYLREIDKIHTHIFNRKSVHVPIELQSQMPFYRLWSIFELFHAISLGVQIVIKAGHHIPLLQQPPSTTEAVQDISSSVTTTYSDNNTMVKKFVSKISMFLRMCECVDVETATVLDPADRVMILERIRRYPGAARSVNEKVREVIRTALYGCHSPLVQCAACGDSEALRVILTDQTGKYINSVAAGGHISWLRKMIEKVDREAYGESISHRNRMKDEALLYAARGGQLCCVAYLVGEEAADVDARDRSDMTSLMYACSGGHLSCVEYLLNKGADVGARDGRRGLTALMYAAEEGHISCLKCLRIHGADVHTRDLSSFTALHYARMNGHTHCGNYLVSQGASAMNPCRCMRVLYLCICCPFLLGIRVISYKH